MRMEDIREFTDKEVQENIKETEQNLTKMRLAHAVSPLENPTRINKTKKDLAKLKTEHRNRKLQNKKNV